MPHYFIGRPNSNQLREMGWSERLDTESFQWNPSKLSIPMDIAVQLREHSLANGDLAQ